MTIAPSSAAPPISRLPLAPPSRRSNPFATCWTRPGALPFQFSEGDSAERFVERLAANGWWGEVLGPHGSGKSTLLETLKPALAEAGCRVRSTALRNRQRWLPSDFLFRDEQRVLYIVDGFEQLGRLARVWLKHRCRRVHAGLLVTSHAPTGLPPLVTLAPDLPLVEQLVAALCEQTPSRIAPTHVAASHAGCGSNVRDIFFDLYDRHEELRSAG